MECCGKQTEVKTNSIVTQVDVPDVAVKATEILFVPHGVGIE